MLKKLILAGLLVSASASAWAQSGQLGANQIWGNPSASAGPSKPSNVGSFLTQGTGLTISGTPKATIAITSTITAAGPSGSATQTPVITYNAQGQLTLVTLATIAPPFSAVTGSLACSQRPALTGFVTAAAGSCATSLGATVTIAQGGTGQTGNTAAFNALAPTPTRTGDIIYWGGSNWINLPGNNSGTQVLQETASGVPSWTALGTGTLTEQKNTAGAGLTTSGNCDNTTTNAGSPCSYALLLNSATLQASPGNPTGTASATGVMMGLGVSTCRITPVYSSRLLVRVDGQITAPANLVNLASQLKFGTGAGPANAASPTGTSIGSGVTVNLTSSQTASLPGLGGIITGLTPGTAVWLDILLSSSSGTAAISNITCHAMEF
jgi:hypothetical protein